MEFKIILCLLVGTCGVLANESPIQTQHYLTAYMDHQLTLPCAYNGSDWMFIRWTRVSSSPKQVLAALDRGSTKWLPTAPQEFKNHVELHKEVGDDGVVFDLVIDGFMCPDVGTFVCEVVTLERTYTANVTIDIKAHPGTPFIGHDEIEVDAVNSTFSIECKTNVGKPPAELRWSYKLLESDVYEMITDDVVQKNEPAEDCTFNGVSEIELTMTEDLHGAQFMCYTTHSSGADTSSPLNNDVVTLELKDRMTTTTTVLPTTTTFKSMRVEGTGSATSHVISSIILLPCIVIASISPLFYRRS